MFRMYAFTGMLLQAPLIVITNIIHKKLHREDISNMVRILLRRVRYTFQIN